MFQYSVHGLSVLVPFHCPELWPHSGKKMMMDLEVRFGNIQMPCGAVHEPFFWQSTPGRLLFSIPEIARFLIIEGKEIIIESFNSSADEAVRHCLLGLPLAVSALMRGLLPFHGSSVLIGSRAAIFLGYAGSGKSTIAMTFYQRGHKILSDDVTVIKLADNGSLVFPGYPMMRLCSDVVKFFGLQGLRRLTGDPDKFGKSVKNLFCSEPTLVGNLYVMQPGNARNLSVVRLTGADKISELIKHTYVINYLQGMKLQKEHLQQINYICQRFNVFRVSKPPGFASLNSLADKIEEHSSCRISIR